MALSHLDSPTASNKPGGNLDRWVNYDGDLDPTAYHTPYVKDGWLYGAGVQDDSGPTLATLFAAKALQGWSSTAASASSWAAMRMEVLQNRVRTKH